MYAESIARQAKEPNRISGPIGLQSDHAPERIKPELTRETDLLMSALDMLDARIEQLAARLAPVLISGVAGCNSKSDECAAGSYFGQTVQASRQRVERMADRLGEVTGSLAV